MKLFNGDCLEVMRGMADNSVDAIVTDPPYGILKHKIEQAIDIEAFFVECLRVLKPNSFLMYFGRQPTLTEWNSIAFKHFRYKKEIIWYKRQRTTPLNDMGTTYENITTCVKGSRLFNQIFRPYSDVKQSLAEFVEWDALKTALSTVERFLRNEKLFSDAVRFVDGCDVDGFFTTPDKRNEFVTIRNAIRKSPRDLSLVRAASKGNVPQDLISFAPHNKVAYGKDEFNIKHPTVKPIQLMEYLIDLTSKTGDVVFDPFMGSGTTGLACQNMGRDFIGVELFEEYFKIAQHRIQHAQQQTETQPMQLFGNS